MSELSQGAGWWQGSNGQWYPPRHLRVDPPPEPAGEIEAGATQTVTTEGLLAALGNEAVKIRRAAEFLALVAFLQLVMLGLWIFGIIRIEFHPI